MQSDDFLESIIRDQPDPAAFRARVAAIQRRHALAESLTGWMRRIPVLGDLTYSFWSTILSEGVRETCKPRWGMLTFAYLNDGMKPTLWHTWRQLTHDQSDPYTGIYVGGAPRSLKEAIEWENREYNERYEHYLEEDCA